MAGRDAYNSTYSARATSEADPIMRALRKKFVTEPYQLQSNYRYAPTGHLDIYTLNVGMNNPSLHLAWTLFTSSDERVWGMKRLILHPDDSTR